MDDIRENVSRDVAEILAPILKDQAVDLVDLRVTAKGRFAALEIRVDLPYGGVTMAHCARINKILSQELEARNFLEGQYSLEVCSPGLEWPLLTEKDFSRVLNREVRVFLKEPFGQKEEWVGRLISVSAEHVVLKCADQDMAIPWAQIRKGLQVIS